MTKLQYQLLDAIVHSQYHDGHDPIDHATWTWDATLGLGRKAQGVITSTNKKGWTVSQNGGPDDQVIWITKAGYEAWKREKENHRDPDDDCRDKENETV